MAPHFDPIGKLSIPTPPVDSRLHPTSYLTMASTKQTFITLRLYRSLLRASRYFEQSPARTSLLYRSGNTQDDDDAAQFSKLVGEAIGPGQLNFPHTVDTGSRIRDMICREFRTADNDVQVGFRALN